MGARHDRSCCGCSRRVNGEHVSGNRVCGLPALALGSRLGAEDSWGADVTSGIRIHKFRVCVLRRVSFPPGPSVLRWQWFTVTKRGVVYSEGYHRRLRGRLRAVWPDVVIVCVRRFHGGPVREPGRGRALCGECGRALRPRHDTALCLRCLRRQWADERESRR